MATREGRKGRATEDAHIATEAAQARRFGKARTARSAATLEDYTELIADLIAANGEARMADIARRLGVAHPTVSKDDREVEARGSRDRAALSRHLPHRRLASPWPRAFISDIA